MYAIFIYIMHTLVGSARVTVVIVVEFLCTIFTGVCLQVHSTVPRFATVATARLATRTRNINATYKKLYAFYLVRATNLHRLITHFWRLCKKTCWVSWFSDILPVGMALKETETQIQNTICEYLEIRERQRMLLFWRQNTGGIFDVKKQIRRALPKHAKRGVPDIIVIKKGQFIGLEVKSATGRQSPDQKLFEIHTTNNGGFYYIVRSLQEVKQLGL